MKKSRIRSSLMGTTAVVISSVLLAIMSGCGHDKTDTESNAPIIVPEVTSICTTMTTSASTTTTTTTTTITETTMSNTTIVTEMTTMMIQTESQNQTIATVMTEPVMVSETESITPLEEYIAEPTIIEEDVVENATNDYQLPITEQEFILIANVISHEAGSSWIGEYERSCIVASIMNRLYDSRFPDTIDGVVHQQGQMFDVPYYRVDYSGIGYEPIDNAIYAYFNGTYDCGCINSWSGNGYNNYFYYQ